MRRGRVWRRMLAALAATALVCTAAAWTLVRSVGSAADPSHPLATALIDGATDGPTLARIRGTGVTFVRINMEWTSIAPSKPSRTFDASNPADPQYDWKPYDREIVAAVRNGLQPYLTIYAAPAWAQLGPPATTYADSYKPSPKAFAQFALAVARRYSGTFRGLPRVRYFQGWNEPNISLYLMPQLVNGKPVSPAWYRRMLNGFADAVHSVHSDNVVVAAGLAPFRDVTVTSQNPDWGPLSFMRDLLCLGPDLKPTCNAKVEFDVWAQHPYTSGDATHHALLPNDVSLGDLPKVRAVLAAAQRAGHIVSHGRTGFWVTEFSWDSNPPDPQAVPIALETRWVAEALYRMWQNGVSLVTWLELMDGPMATSYYQSGLYYYGSTLAASKPKPILVAFRFPFVAYRSGGKANVWGRTPAGRPAVAIVEQQVSGRWRTLATLRTDQYGIFQAQVGLRSSGVLRARIARTGQTSVPFSLKRPPDHYYNPFGLGTLPERK